MIKAVVFDFGGVLSQFGVLGDSSRRLAKVLGCEPDDVRTKMGPLIGRWLMGQVETADFWRQAAQLVGAPPADYDAKWRAGEITRYDSLYYELARELRRQGIRTGVLSNIGPTSAELVARAGGWRGFDPVVLSCDVGYAKPDPAIYQVLLDRLRLRAEEVLFVDDAPVNLAAAGALGLQTVQAGETAATIAMIRQRLSDDSLPAKKPARSGSFGA